MANRIVDDAYSHVKDVMKGTKEQFKTFQDSPVGKDVRSKKDIGIILKKIVNLPDKERQIRIDELMVMAGHQGVGLDDCGLCAMIKEAN